MKWSRRVFCAGGTFWMSSGNVWAGSPCCNLLSSQTVSLQLYVELWQPSARASEGCGELQGPWGPGALLQTKAAEGRTISCVQKERFLTGTDSRTAAASSVSLKDRLLLSWSKQRRALLYLSSHTLMVKMYFRETCKFFCTVLIICSILSCRNHCDMSSIKQNFCRDLSYCL